MNKDPLIIISNNLLGKYCLERNYQTAQEIDNDELIAWLKTQKETINDDN